MDEIDFEILALLQNDGRISNKVLAAEVGIAPSTCHERLKRLSESGALRSVHGVVDPQILGVGLQAFYMVELVKHDRDVVETFRREALALPEVHQVFLVSGKFDFLIHVTVRDTDHLKDLALDAFTGRPEVTRIETSLIYDFDRSFELPRLK